MVDFDYTPLPDPGDEYKPGGESVPPLNRDSEDEPGPLVVDHTKQEGTGVEFKNPEPTAEEPPALADESTENPDAVEEEGPTLTFEEGRVLGCLMEKAKTTPDAYPLSLNSLTSACNQKTSRLPVTDFDEGQVMEATEGLRFKRLVHRVDQAGARTMKFQHRASETLELTEAEVALLCVLLLRGPQTLGELRNRTERLHGFDSTAEIEEVFRDLAARSEPLIKVIPPSQGRKEPRYHQLVGDYPLDLSDSATVSPVYQPAPKVSADRVEALEVRVAGLEEQLKNLNSDFERFKELLD